MSLKLNQSFKKTRRKKTTKHTATTNKNRTPAFYRHYTLRILLVMPGCIFKLEINTGVYIHTNISFKNHNYTWVFT